MLHQSMNSVGNYRYNRYFYSSTSFFPHFHKNYEFIYVTTGEASVTADKKSFDIKKGELIIVSPNVIHSFKVGSDSEIWVGVFSADFISLFAKKNKNIYFSPFSLDDFTKELLHRSLFNPEISDIYLMKSALYAVCALCERNAAALKLTANSDIKTEILEYISLNYTDNITLESTASAFGYEAHYFSKLFHSWFDVNFKDMINMLRFEIACELIEKTDDTLTDIAMKSGFGSVRSFNRIFKQISGKTPKEYFDYH